MPRRHRPPTTLPNAPIIRAQADIEIMRSLMDLAGMWRGCYRSCRRRKSCASPIVKCFDYNIERVRDFSQRLADWPRLDGPRDLDELVEPVDDPFD